MVKSFHTIWKSGKQERTSDKSPSSRFPAFQIPIDSSLAGLGVYEAMLNAALAVPAFDGVVFWDIRDEKQNIPVFPRTP